jgi:hypothetical protein
VPSDQDLALCDGALRIKGFREALRRTASKRTEIAGGKRAALTLRLAKRVLKQARTALLQGEKVRADHPCGSSMKLGTSAC